MGGAKSNDGKKDTTLSGEGGSNHRRVSWLKRERDGELKNSIVKKKNRFVLNVQC